MNKRRASEHKQITEGKVLAILSYLSVLCIIPLAFQKNNPFVMHHGKQGLVIFVAEVALFVIHIILGAWILKLGIFILGVFSFVGIIFVLRGEYVQLPIVHKIAEQITL